MIHIVVALPAEARPLVAAFGLKRRAGCGPFAVFDGDAMTLVVCGVGRVAAAAACGWLGAGGGGGHRGWVNIGIAGHPFHALGRCLVAHSIRDPATGRRWYPPQVFSGPWETEALETVDSPRQDYGEEVMVDMEAAGFFPTATRFATAELVQCIKVISDNRHRGPQHITAAGVEALVADALPVIEPFVAAVDALSRELDRLRGDDALEEEYLSRWRFTRTQRHQLARLLRRWRVLAGDAPPGAGRYGFLGSGRAVLQALEDDIGAMPPRLGPRP